MFGPWFTGSLPAVEPRQWKQRLRCFSLGMFPAGNKLQHERGDKILLPGSALHKLTRLNQQSGVMLFKLEHNERVTHCGVLEFSAVEGHMYIPFWMMANLCLEEGGVVNVSSVNLPKAEFTKIQPMETEFLRLVNPKAVLEHELRHFTCLTQGDQITIQYAGDRYNIHIKELWPAAACCSSRQEHKSRQTELSNPTPMRGSRYPPRQRYKRALSRLLTVWSVRAEILSTAV